MGRRVSYVQYKAWMDWFSNDMHFIITFSNQKLIKHIGQIKIPVFFFSVAKSNMVIVKLSTVIVMREKSLK